MCGLGGYAGVGSEAFTKELGLALDDRGGHASGFITDKCWGTKVGPWAGSRRRFSRRAGEGAVGILHARWATCGSYTQRDAHPFEIRRKGQPVLYGAHNGMIYDADESANAHQRPYTVDSRELFELIADGAFNEISKLSGYGVAAWMSPGVKEVNLVRMTTSGEIKLISLVGGGFAWASTWEILSPALIAARLLPLNSYELKPGVVYKVSPDRIVSTKTRCSLGTYNWADHNWNKYTASMTTGGSKRPYNYMDEWESEGIQDDDLFDNTHEAAWRRWAKVGKHGG